MDFLLQEEKKMNEKPVAIRIERIMVALVLFIKKLI